MRPPSAADTRRGILFMLLTTLIFAIQDGLSRHLAEAGNVMTVVFLRYLFFAAFVIALAARQEGGLSGALRARRPVLQALRGFILVAEICVMVLAFTRLGLIEAHAVFTSYPLIIALLSGPFLGERVGWRRRAAIGVGFLGILLILRPGVGVFSADALIPLLSATLFAVYGLLTRYVSRTDRTATSFFYTGVFGAIGISLVAPFYWQPFESGVDWALMGLLCLTGAAGHYTMIKAYDAAEASAVQPFAFFHLVFVVIIGMAVFGEPLAPLTALGTGIVVAAGLFTFWREAVAAQRP